MEITDIFHRPGASKGGAETAFKKAVREGNIKTVKDQLAQGSSVQISNEDELPPLVSAIINDHVEIAKLLIENKADVNSKSWGMTPLEWAENIGNPEMENLFKKK